MTDPPTTRVELLFHELLGREPSERAASLAELRARDAGLAAEVEALIAAFDRSEERFADAPAPQRPRPEEAIGSRVGPYRLAELIGEGGMGCVYLARQEEPFRRRVALKIVRPGTHARDALERFEVERRALACMSHPAIAAVHDAGATDGGLPWFAMELVEGEPITAYCDGRRAGLRRRLRLFVDVCNAIQHAHQKGILHRDLKPSNVLVAEVDGQPAVKVIDFGIAKVLGGAPAGGRLETVEGRWIGTPEYMSPEQAASAEEVDSRTDVYALGLLLYELLCGELPFSVSARTPVELAKLWASVREEDPPTPSSRVDRGAHEVSRARCTRSPEALARRLRGDLDWIAAKALQRDPGQRYASASELARDVLRHLDGDPVLAGPPSASYRLRKLVVRYRRTAIAVVVSSAAIVAALIWIAVSEAGTSRRLQRLNRELEAERDLVLRLADHDDYETLVADAEALWPAVPDRIDDYVGWLRRAGELVANLGLHEATLSNLRESALPYSEADLERDRIAHPLRIELEGLERQRQFAEHYFSQIDRVRADEWDGWTELDEPMASVPARIRALEEVMAERYVWRFERSADQWQHDRLADLVDGVRSLIDPEDGLAADVRARLARAERLRDERLAGPSEAWRRAIAEVGDPEVSPIYAGLDLSPQVGLTPLGADPESGLQEFALDGTGAVPERGQDGRLIVTEDMGIVLVLVPGGTFRMGARLRSPGKTGSGPNVDPWAQMEETPPHSVALDPFFLAKYETTQGQWYRLSGENPSVYSSNFEKPGLEFSLLHPVENVSWTDARAFLRKRGLDLPTEAQWERACRAGTRTVWWSGDEPQSLFGAVNAADASAVRLGLNWESARRRPDLNDGHVGHAPVDALLPNPFGLHHMTGNVSEWCRDELCVYPPSTVAPGDGYRSLVFVYLGHVVRGGSYRTDLGSARSAARDHLDRDSRREDLGVRAARALDRE